VSSPPTEGSTHGCLVLLSRLVVALVLSPALLQRGLLLSRLLNPVPALLERQLVRRVRLAAVGLHLAQPARKIRPKIRYAENNNGGSRHTHVLSTAAVTFSPCTRQARGLASRCLHRMNSRLASAHSCARIRAAHVRLVLSVSGSLTVLYSSAMADCVRGFP
jgi:hypothetical protein